MRRFLSADLAYPASASAEIIDEMPFDRVVLLRASITHVAEEHKNAHYYANERFKRKLALAHLCRRDWQLSLVRLWRRKLKVKGSVPAPCPY